MLRLNVVKFKEVDTYDEFQGERLHKCGPGGYPESCYINHKSTTFVLILLLNLTAVFLSTREIQTVRLKTFVKIGASL